jgi:hypothetical protein
MEFFHICEFVKIVFIPGDISNGVIIEELHFYQIELIIGFFKITVNITFII